MGQNLTWQVWVEHQQPTAESPRTEARYDCVHRVEKRFQLGVGDVGDWSMAMS